MNIMSKIEVCGCKISSATSFIDFFVHDILDYTLLISKIENFCSNNQMFNIQTAIKELKEIMQDKVSMKNISIRDDYNSFFSNYIVKTDMKRMQ